MIIVVFYCANEISLHMQSTENNCMAYDKHSVSGTIITPTLLEVHLVICINYVEPSNSIIMDGLKYLCA